MPEIVYADAEEGASTNTLPRAGKLEDEPVLDPRPVYRYRLKHRQTHGR